MIIGMDFGTTNSGMSVFDGERLKLIPLDPSNQNASVARTALYITNDRMVHIGRNATDTYYEQNLNRPSKLERVRVGEVEMTFAEIGTFIQDVYIEKDVFSPGRLFLSFKMALSSPKYLGTVVGNEYYFLEDIIATYLYVSKKRAEAFLEHEVDTIVLGRPVRFSDEQEQNNIARERLLQSAFRAGYKKVYLQYEPIAAAYHYEQSIDKEQNVLIFDFGGGTLDISIMRIGNPKTRAVLATGGIPIAGDIFDQKIVRKKLPRHFGEGGHYTHINQKLPIPSSFYDAFSNWQDLLALQLPERIGSIKMIARTANEPLKIRALMNLITSNYALKMFDFAEQQKRVLSAKDQTLLHFDGPGFAVRDILTKTEFEHLIRSDIRAISARLDNVITQAGLKSEQIDAVIRTGGSSQIPAFIDMLASRFGTDKVKNIDAFSSVTSGLGLIAHEIEQGIIDLPAYTPKTQTAGSYLDAKTQGGVPVIELDTMKRYIDLKEFELNHTDDTVTLLTKTTGEKLQATGVHIHNLDEKIPLEAILPTPHIKMPIQLQSNDAHQILMTSEYRFLIKTPQQLIDLETVGTNLEDSENFATDAFGNEAITGIVSFDNMLKDAEKIIMLTSTGYARVFLAEGLLQELKRPIPFQVPTSSGYPVTLLATNVQSEIIIFSQTGRATCVARNQLNKHEQRLIKMPANTYIIGAISIDKTEEILVVTESGYAKRISSDVIKNTPLNNSGKKIIGRSNPVHAIRYQPKQQLYAITNKHIIPIEQDKIPLMNAKTTPHKLCQLTKSETVIALTYSPSN